MSAILNNQIKLLSKAHLSSFAMTSVHSHWLIAKPFVLSLYKCDTTRMVGRLLYSTTIYTSLLISPYTCTNKSYILLTLRPLRSYTYSPRISLIPLIYLPSLLLTNPRHIPTQPTSHHCPTYTYTAYISSLSHIYLHSLHLINPPHTPTHPTSH